eukprot:s1607_g2.t1
MASPASSREEPLHREASRLAVRTNLEQVMNVALARHSRLVMCTVVMLLTGMLLILFWSQMVFSSHEFDSCDQPLALMIRLIFVIVMVQTMQKAISRHCLCYDAVEDGPPEPLRVRVFRALAASAAVLWPLVAGVMLFQSKNCSKALTTAVAVIIGYYLILVIVVLVLPAVALGAVLCLIRSGRLRLPRMPGAAPEGAVESLPAAEFDSGRFCQDGRGEFPASCAVCLETFTAQKEIVKMPCNHVFHRSCLSGWFQVARTCPLCRGDVEQVIALMLSRKRSLGASNSEHASRLCCEVPAAGSCPASRFTKTSTKYVDLRLLTPRRSEGPQD